MMYASSFWDRCKVNNRRRVWVWFFSIVSVLILMVGNLSVQFARESRYYNSGAYRSEADYKIAMQITALESLVNPYLLVLITILAVTIAIQGYSYLFSKSKVDMYHSVPVSMKSRFFTIYVNGVLIFLASILIASFACIILMCAKGIMTGSLMGKLLLNLILELFAFLAIYDVAIFSVMLTGNVFMATVMSLVFTYYVDIWREIISSYGITFFRTYTSVFDDPTTGISILNIFTVTADRLNNNYVLPVNLISIVIVAIVKLSIWALITIFFAFLNYKKRPAEAAGSSMAFYSSRILVKLFVTIPCGLLFGIWMYEVGEKNIVLSIIAMVISTIIIAMLTEIAFNFEFKSAIRHWGSIIVALIVVGIIFFAYRADLFGFDKFIPKTDEIESYALLNNYECYYSSIINFDADTNDYSGGNINPYIYVKDNMQLMDVEAIVELSKKSELLSEEDDSVIPLDVYYRLKNDKTRSRRILIDLDDETNDDYLNRIIGPAYYKMGVWQAMTMDAPRNRVLSVSYSTILDTCQLNVDDVNQIIDIWRKDMGKYDYDRVRYDYEAGYISILFDNYATWELPVYSCFDGLDLYLKDNGRYISAEIEDEAVDKIKITNYLKKGDKKNDYPVEREFTNYDEIVALMNAIKPVPCHMGWMPSDTFDSDYLVEIMLMPNYIAKYNSYNLLGYQILSDWVYSLSDTGLLP